MLHRKYVQNVVVLLTRRHVQNINQQTLVLNVAAYIRIEKDVANIIQVLLVLNVEELIGGIRRDALISSRFLYALSAGWHVGIRKLVLMLLFVLSVVLQAELTRKGVLIKRYCPNAQNVAANTGSTRKYALNINLRCLVLNAVVYNTDIRKVVPNIKIATNPVQNVDRKLIMLKHVLIIRLQRHVPSVAAK